MCVIVVGEEGEDIWEMSMCGCGCECVGEEGEEIWEISE